MSQCFVFVQKIVCMYIGKALVGYKLVFVYLLGLLFSFHYQVILNICLKANKKTQVLFSYVLINDQYLYHV